MGSYWDGVTGENDRKRRQHYTLGLAATTCTTKTQIIAAVGKDNWKLGGRLPLVNLS